MKLYQDMERRTGGNVYIGVTGPVRVGKSTFVKRFMEELVLPNIPDEYARERARDELPQSGSGRTIMTAEPKFVPEEAVEISPDGVARLSVRLIDSVGYIIPGALGATEDGTPRMVTTPWFDQEIPMTDAAELGTRKVMEDHCTVGLVITTDGSVTDIPRDDYLQAETRAIQDMKATGKPFLVLLNTRDPESPQTRELARTIAETTGASVHPADLLALDRGAIGAILTELLGQFPPQALTFAFPSWFDALELDHPCKRRVFRAIRDLAPRVRSMAQAEVLAQGLEDLDQISTARVEAMDLGQGTLRFAVTLPESLFYEILSQRSGVSMENDGDLLRTLGRYAAIRGEYERIQAALEQVRTTGYGIVMPAREEVELQTPELIRKAGACGVRLRASAPSIHLLRADLSAELRPMVGDEKQSQELAQTLTEAYEAGDGSIWQSNIFGKTLYDLVNEGLNAKLSTLPQEARMKLRRALERIVNEGANGLICLVL